MDKEAAALIHSLNRCDGVRWAWLILPWSYDSLSGYRAIYRTISNFLAILQPVLRVSAMLELHPSCECCNRDLPARIARDRNLPVWVYLVLTLC
jgi:hypothetical protein